MSIAVSVDVRPFGTSVPLRMDERVFPSELAGRQSSSQPPPRLEGVDPIDALKVRLAEALWDRLPLASLKKTADLDAEGLVTIYVESLKQVHQFRQDAEALRRAICAANVEFRQASGETNGEARDKALDTRLAELSARASFDIVPARNVLSAELISRPLETLRSKLTAALREAVDDFAHQLFASFEKLVDEKCLGLIEWVGPNVCRYHFFKEVVIQEMEGPERTAGPYRSAGRVGDRTRRYARTVTQTTRGRHVHRTARHEHHVMQAFWTSIRNSRVVMPLAVRQLVKAVPDWLYDFVRVVDGILVRELVIERDLGEEGIKSTQQYTDYVFVDEPVVDWEPAVVVGPFVLTGWGPREIEIELKRQAETTQGDQQTRHIASAGWRRTVFSAVAVVAPILSLVFFIRASSSAPSWAYPATAFLLAGLWAVMLAIREHLLLGESQKNRPPEARISITERGQSA